MNQQREPMVRLTERGGVGPGVPDQQAAARAAVLLRLLQAAPLRFSSAARARIAARLQEQESMPIMAPRRMYWPAAGAATLVLFAGGAVGATWGLGPAQKLFGRWMRSDAPQTRSVGIARPVAPESALDHPAPELSAALTAPKTLATTIIEPQANRPLGQALGAEPRRRKPAPAVSVGVTVTELPAEPAPAVDPVVAESRLLGDALSQLRQGREPARALRTLDDYERRFPKGALMPEASAARIDALLALGRRGEALDRLDALTKIDSLPRAAEMRVLRGELRAGRGALPGAVSDFGAVLGMAGASDAVVERALYGRGSSRARLGDAAGARADLQDYLRRFPQGRFAGPAGRALRD